MTIYEKLTQIDAFADLIYDRDCDIEACVKSPYRLNGECPHAEDDRCKKTCRECIKAWLNSEVEE